MTTPSLRIPALAALLAVVAACSSAAGGNSTPEGIPAKLGAAAASVREGWQRDAMLVRVVIDRPDAQSAFSYRYVFASSNSPKFMELKEGRGGTAMAEQGFRDNVEVVPGTQVMDLARAIDIAREAGMKGNLLTAELRQWTPDDETNTVPVVVWRLVPDEDPNLADPNDPNMKNYYVDALLGTVYDPDKPVTEQVLRGSEAFGAAVTREMTAMVESLRQGR